MNDSLFVMLECSNPECRFRFPDFAIHRRAKRCPACSAELLTPQAAFENHNSPPADLSNGLEVHVLLDNLRSVLNVGSIFRTADGAGVSRLILGGITATPNHPQLAKTSLGAEHSLPWEHTPNGRLLCEKYKTLGFRILSLESTPDSTSLFHLFNGKPPESVNSQPPARLLFVVGNEISGVDPAILSLSDHICHIPMAGMKESLNVAVAFGIAIYYLRFGIFLE